MHRNRARPEPFVLVVLSLHREMEMWPKPAPARSSGDVMNGPAAAAAAPLQLHPGAGRSTHSTTILGEMRTGSQGGPIVIGQPSQPQPQPSNKRSLRQRQELAEQQVVSKQGKAAQARPTAGFGAHPANANAQAVMAQVRCTHMQCPLPPPCLSPLWGVAP